MWREPMGGYVDFGGYSEIRKLPLWLIEEMNELAIQRQRATRDKKGREPPVTPMAGEDMEMPMASVSPRRLP
ncbi:MAG: hypothetical protein FJ098_00570 [Deltaproteobacteria bacterium]|nr:hypothetical protein [Deltaproteobacteria bacterium]